MTPSIRLRPRPRRHGAAKPAVLLGVAAAAATGYAVVSREVERRGPRVVDRKARQRIQREMRPRLKQAAGVISPLGKGYVLAPLAGAAAAFTRPRSRSGALAIGLASVGAELAAQVLDRVHAHRSPPPGRGEDVQSFPSGHSLRTAAIALTTAWVLAREERSGAKAIVPIALALPVLSGAAKVYDDHHWVSDAVGGWLAGAAVAASCAAAYEAFGRQVERSPLLGRAVEELLERVGA